MQHTLTRGRVSRGRVTGLVLALALVLAACGGGDDEPTEEPAEEEPAEEEPAEEEPAEEEPAEEEPAEEEPAAAGEFEYVDGVLQPNSNGFPDRPLTLVVVDDPGTRDSLYASDMATALEDISPVEIVVSHEPHPQGGTLPTMSELMERDGGMEGYFPEVTTLVGTPTDLHIEPIEQDWGVGLDDVQFVIATEEQPYVMVQKADAEWGETFDDFIAYAEENPGELRYISAGVGSGHDIAMSWVLDSLGLEVNKIPAQGHQEALSAIGAGEGDFTMTRAELAYQTETEGRVKTIFMTSDGVPAPWTDEDGIKSRVDYPEYGLDDIAWGIVLGYMIPSEAPDENIAWLHELFKAGVETPGWADRVDAVPGLNIFDTPLTPEESNALVQDVFDFSEPVVREIGLHWEDNQ